MRLADYLGQVALRVEEALDRYLPPEQAHPSTIHRAMRYSACGAGKRLRAALVLASAETAGGGGEAPLALAAAVEMIHAYSLVHDDLPAMDDDDYRRGKPTSHRVFGEGMAILAGDALLTRAFWVLAQLPAQGVRAEVALAVMEEVARAAGTDGLIGGQVVDLESEGRAVDAETLRDIHSRKTGALITGAVRAGALVAGAGDEALSALTRYGRHFGLAFQITDDILNVVGDAAKLGKAVGSDAKRQKATYPALFGLEDARRAARHAAAEARAALAPFGERARLLAELADLVVTRES